MILWPFYPRDQFFGEGLPAHGRWQLAEVDFFSIFRPFARISKLHFFEFPKKIIFTPPYWVPAT